ncbi:hypothetical protein B0T17DRAFT_505860 [Bombardia bombarda]|uniref:Uncharacterized protein n=1 Tax=Bombardia bombarda TaxID=252184 RepID=A0AA39X8I0_9PEZI|nr:hypothetical protein B0T17DRAFT_505860 [Bombardia bombarda]
MDHIPLPHDALAAPQSRIMIPYVCTREFAYDDDGWSGYPGRVSMNYVALSQDQCIRTLARIPLRQAGPFIQAYFWVGLLSHTLGAGKQANGDFKRFDIGSFTRAGPGPHYQPILDTRTLIQVLSKRKQTFSHQNQDPRPLDKLAEILKITASFTYVSIQTLLGQWRARKDYLRQQNVPEAGDKQIAEIMGTMRIILSVQVLWQTIYEAYGFCNHPDWGLNSERRLRNMNMNASTTQLMLLSKGWPKSVILAMPGSVSLQYHVWFLNNKPRALDPEQRYEPSEQFRHRLPDCTCTMANISEQVVNAASREARTIVVCRYNRHGWTEFRNVYLNENNEPDRPFVAISYPTTAGLMNYSANSLPSCQMSCIQAHVDVLQRDEGHESNFFWLGTLCLPARETGLAHGLLPTSRHGIFAAATRVLVLDPLIYNQHLIVPAQLPSLEALIRIRYSDWKQETSCLVQGLMAKQLFFLFANIDEDAGIDNNAVQDNVNNVDVNNDAKNNDANNNENDEELFNQFINYPVDDDLNINNIINNFPVPPPLPRLRTSIMLSLDTLVHQYYTQEVVAPNRRLLTLLPPKSMDGIPLTHCNAEADTLLPLLVRRFNRDIDMWFAVDPPLMVMPPVAGQGLIPHMNVDMAVVGQGQGQMQLPMVNMAVPEGHPDMNADLASPEGPPDMNVDIAVAGGQMQPQMEQPPTPIDRNKLEIILRTATLMATKLYVFAETESGHECKKELQPAVYEALRATYGFDEESIMLMNSIGDRLRYVLRSVAI